MFLDRDFVGCEIKSMVDLHLSESMISELSTRIFGFTAACGGFCGGADGGVGRPWPWAAISKKENEFADIYKQVKR